MEHAPTTPLGARTPHAHPAYMSVVTALALAALIGGYLALANAMEWWPYEDDVVDVVHEDWRTYTHAAGFSMQYPPTAQLGSYGDDNMPLLTLEEGGQVTVSTGMGTVGHDDKSFSPSTPATVAGMDAESYTYEAPGGCHGILVVVPDGGEGDRDFLINYDDCYVGGGSPDFPSSAQLAVLNRILASFRFTPANPEEQKDDVDGAWLPFSSQYFTLSFNLPQGLKIEESTDYLLVSEHGTGSNPDSGPTAWLQRYNGTTHTTATARTAFSTHNIDVTASTVVVDGAEFPRLDGTDPNNGYHSSLIFFDKSSLLLSPGMDPDGERLALLNLLLSTFRFSR